MSTRNSLAVQLWRRTFLLAVLTVSAALNIAAIPATNPVPIITFLSPISANPGGAGFTLTVNGANFVNAVSVVNWNGTPLATTFTNSATLTAAVTSAQIESGGTGWITVFNPGCAGECNRTSNVFYFPVTNPISTYDAVELTAPVGSGPISLSEGDFNGDGKLDLAVSNYEGSSVSILLGNGDGTFQPQATLGTLSQPFGSAVGDINGDGIPDLVVGNDLESGGLDIFLGDGSGGFTAGIALEGGSCLMEPVLADVNGDGYLDIVVGNYCGSGIEVFLGNGDGTFGAPSVIGTGAVLGLVVADFNGDGILDLVAANYGNGLLGIYLGVGDGTFGSVSPIVLPDVFQVVAADVNGDGEVDLVTASESSGINLLYGNGDGTFQAAVLAASGGYLALAAGDLSGNGSLDITAIGTSASVKVLFANGEGTYQAPKVLGSAFSYGIALGNFATTGGLDVAVANLDADQADVFLPTVVISPSSKNFGSVSVGGGSAQQIFTVTNDSPSTVTISAISFTGADPEDFSQSNTCSTALATAGTCTVTVTFAPAAAGARAATLTLTDDAPTTPQIALLTGTGTATPLATLSTTSLNFGSQTLHVTSASQPMTLTNTGTASLTGIVISVTGTNNSDFGLITNCDATLTASSLCTVNVTFMPSVVGAESAALEFSDNAANTPQLVQLSGTGLDVATNLNYVQAPPASLLAGSSIGNTSVGVYDANSVLVTASSASVTVTITGPNSFSQSQTAAASAGIASFNFGSVPLDLAGQYTETALSSGLGSGISTTMVTPLLSSEQMVVAGFPSPTYANVSHPFTISVTDSFGNPISSYAGTVTLASSDPNALLTPPTYTFVGADMGAHIFTANLVTVGAQMISAGDGTLSGSEAGIVVSPRPQLVANLLPDDAGAASACDGSESCSLRSAIHLANALGAGDITVDTSQFAGSAPWTSILMNGPLELNSTVNLSGPGQIGIGLSGAGQNQLSLSGNNLSSVFQVDAGAIASITGLSATLGNSSGNGGGIGNAGSLTLTNVTVSDSVAAEDGGGIYSSGSLTVNSSVLSGNTAGANGGGAATAGTSIFYDSTIAGNTAAGVGGGIANSGGLSMPQSTVYGNTAFDGAGIENETAGTLVMAQSTVSGNIASSDSGGTVTNQSEAQGAVTILNSIVAGNTAPNGDCVNCRLQTSFNLFDIAAAALLLGPLTNNGGFTETLLPLAGSPAIASGSVALATNSGLPESLANDQRGNGYLRIVNNSVDLGSIQYNSGPASSFVSLVTGSPVAGNALTLTLHALTTGGNPDETYAGTVEFASSDPHAVLPANYTFVPSDNGTHIFTVTLQTSGSQTIVATDAANSSLQATQTIVVSPAAAAMVVVSAGSGQTAPIEAAFATALSAKVSDGFGNAVPGTTIVFSAPSSGASGTFAGGALSASVASGSNGVATAPVFTANAVTGQYSVAAAVTGLSTATFALTNAALSAASMTLAAAGSAVAGSPLNVTASALTANAAADMSYAGTLHFTSTDAQAVLPVDYTFVPSDAGTHVFSLTMKTSGSQSVTATDTVNSALHATQTMVESPAAAAMVAASAGSGQTALEGAAFATALAAKVSDAFGNLVPGTTVIFSAPSSSTPSSGAGGTFAGGGSSASVTTGGTGIATAPAFTANGTAGAYSVSAGVQGLTSVTFALTNAAPIIVQPPDYSITAAPAALTIVEGQSGSTVLTLTPVGGMTGTAAFTCTGLPAKAACVFAPVQVVMSGNDAVQTVTLTVNTTGTNGVIAGIHPASFPWNAAGMLAFLAMPAGLLFLVIPGSFIPRLIIPCLIIPGSVRKGSIRNGSNRQGYVRLWLVLLLGSFAAIGMTSCGGISSSGGGGTEAATPPGQYSISAAASVTGATGHSALVTITVTQ